MAIRVYVLDRKCFQWFAQMFWNFATQVIIIVIISLYTRLYSSAYDKIIKTIRKKKTDKVNQCTHSWQS